MTPVDKLPSNVPGIASREPLNRPAPTKPKSEAEPFSKVFGDRLEPSKTTTPKVDTNVSELKFSSHAQTRMQSRGIELSPDEMLRIREAVGRAGAKGSKESLVLTDKAAFVVSVKNGTVITAMDRDSMKENVFTNIDSTIMI
jgi:flagellar operon protein